MKKLFLLSLITALAVTPLLDSRGGGGGGHAGGGGFHGGGGGFHGGGGRGFGGGGYRGGGAHGFGGGGRTSGARTAGARTAGSRTAGARTAGNRGGNRGVNRNVNRNVNRSRNWGGRGRGWGGRGYWGGGWGYGGWGWGGFGWGLAWGLGAGWWLWNPFWYGGYWGGYPYYWTTYQQKPIVIIYKEEVPYVINENGEMVKFVDAFPGTDPNAVPQYKDVKKSAQGQKAIPKEYLPSQPDNYATTQKPAESTEYRDPRRVNRYKDNDRVIIEDDARRFENNIDRDIQAIEVGA